MRRPGTWLRAAAVLVAIGVIGTPVAGRGTRAGVYTTAQAQEGARLYAVRCAMCHGRQLEGSVEIPTLTGRFVANWGARPVGDLFDYVSRAMPQPAPGSLSPQENAGLVAFLLQANGAPPGDRALPADSAALRRISFDTAPPP